MSINIISEQAAMDMVRNPEGRIPGLIAVHDGVFHADDAHFVAALNLVSPGKAIVRTRNQEILAAAEIVGDVGGVYDKSANRFDHHQKGGAGARANEVPYASFGLLWAHQGWALDIVGSILHAAGIEGESFGEIVQLVDANLAQAIDAADCGYTASNADEVSLATGYGIVDATPRMSLSAVIAGFNPDWTEAPDFDAAFARAVEFAKAILTRAVIRAAGEVKARAVVRAALGNLDRHSEDSQILVLDCFCPWQETVLEYGPTVKFVVFPAEDGGYRVQTVPVAIGSFKARMSLPESWAGLRGMELALAVRTSGGAIADSEAVFCHNGRFVAGATTLGAAMQMAWAATGRLKGVQDRERV